ncbi:hypothetical protein [Kaarinaea lacus]
MKDAQTTVVDGYPYLHVNRFLVALKPHIDHPDKLNLWMQLAAQLALQTHSIEIKNLPDSAQNELTQITPIHLQSREPSDVLVMCSQILLHHALIAPINQQHILHNAKVPDNYHTWKRIMGLYPLVSLPVAAGIQNWHKKSSSTLQTPAAELPIEGNLVRYVTDTQSAYNNVNEIQSAIFDAKQNALEIPLPDEETQQRLFTAFSPIWEVDTIQNGDRLGAPVWPSNDLYAHVDTSLPIVFTLLSHTIFNDEILLQLNYIVWFPRRPCTSSLDFLCGQIDGLTWRVTLGSDGNPLIYDAIHNCGCYHTFFPTDYLQPISPPPITVESRINLDETAFSPIQAPQVKPPLQLVLRIASTTHHIESVYILNNADKSHMFEEVSASQKSYHTLRSLPYNDPQNDQRNKSLFQEDAIVAGTQRKERWFFWPLGVPSAGAMRQWGNHATAFIGRRHFDEPFLFDNAFRRVNP